MAQINCWNQACAHILGGAVNYCPYCGTDQRIASPPKDTSAKPSNASHDAPVVEAKRKQVSASIQTSIGPTARKKAASAQQKVAKTAVVLVSAARHTKLLKVDVAKTWCRKMFRPIASGLSLLVRGVRMSILLVVTTVLLSAGIIMTYLFHTQDKDRKVVSSTRITMPTPPPKPAQKEPAEPPPALVPAFEEIISNGPLVAATLDAYSAPNESVSVDFGGSSEPSSNTHVQAGLQKPSAPLFVATAPEPLVETATNTPEQSLVKTWPLRVTTNLAAGLANIRIMNIAPVYYDGIELASGRYDVLVTALGHKSERRWITLPSTAKEVAFYLSPLKAITVTNLPAGAYALDSQGTRHPLPYSISGTSSMVEFTVTAPGFYTQFISVDSLKTQTVIGHLRPIKCGVIRQQGESFSSMGRTTFDLGPVSSSRVLDHIYQSWKKFENGRTRVTLDGHMVTMREYSTGNSHQYIDHHAQVYDVYSSTRVELVSAMRGHIPVLDRLDLKAGARLFCTMMKGV